MGVIDDGALCFAPTLRLISAKLQDPGSTRPSFVGLVKKWLYIRLFSEKLVVSFFLLLVAPASVSAFTFSSLLSDILNGTAKTTSAAEETHTLANLPLLQAARNLDPNAAKGGGDITIVGGIALLPATGPYGTLADIKDRSEIGGQISIYVVRDGDSLSGIAKMFGVSVNTIVWGNNIKNGLIHEGETLVILPISGVRYTIKKEDTLQSIAADYKGDLSEILQYNGLTENSKLAIGDIIIIPDGVLVTPAYKGAPSVASGSGSTYSGYYIRPMSGYRSQGIHGYNGVDIAAPYGTPIVAAAAGKVIVARDSGWNGGYGQYVVISHGNGTQTLYAHMANVVVYVGQTVVQGQVVGYEGMTGKVTGPHLHFEVRGARNPF